MTGDNNMATLKIFLFLGLVICYVNAEPIRSKRHIEVEHDHHEDKEHGEKHHHYYHHYYYHNEDHDHHEYHHDESHEHQEHDHHHDHEEHHHHENHEHHHGSREHHHGSHEHELHGSFKFQMGNDFGPYEYLDDDGNLKGFYVDLMNEVCAAANHKCYAVYDNPQNCWYASANNYIQKPGQGLMSGWYDGCIGYTQSPERATSFDFTHPFTNNYVAAIYVPEGTTRSCDPVDLEDLKIGFIHGWSINQNCIARHFKTKGNMQGDYYETVYDRYESMITAIVKKEIDALFSVPDYIADHLRMEPLCNVTFTCTKAGITVMTQKGSPVTTWWNKAFDLIVDNGQFEKLCANATKKHGHRGDVNCL